MNFLRSIIAIVSFIATIFEWRNPNVIRFLKDRYDHQDVNLYRRLETASKKLSKSKLDLLFLRRCKTYNIVPKFLRFKLHRKSLCSSKFYKSWQIKLLDLEMSDKTKSIEKLENDVKISRTNLLRNKPVLDSYLIRTTLERTVKIYTEKTALTHERKLKNLGLYNHLEPCDPNKIVHNFSSKAIPARVKNLLAFGLDFNLPIYNLDFYKYFAPMESIAYRLSKEKCNGNFLDFLEKFKHMSFKYFYNFKPEKSVLPNIWTRRC